MNKHTEAETKWTTFNRRHIQTYFLQWKCLNFDSNFTAVCSSGSNYQYSSIGSDNGLATTRQQAIIWIMFSLVMHICVIWPQWVNSKTHPVLKIMYLSWNKKLYLKHINYKFWGSKMQNWLIFQAEVLHFTITGIHAWVFCIQNLFM